MRLTEESREAAMEMLCAMTIEDLARESGKTTDEVFKEFRRSRTFSMLFDPDTGLWLNGPDYIVDEYNMSAQIKKDRVSEKKQKL